MQLGGAQKNGREYIVFNKLHARIVRPLAKTLLIYFGFWFLYIGVSVASKIFYTNFLRSQKRGELNRNALRMPLHREDMLTDGNRAHLNTSRTTHKHHKLMCARACVQT